LAACICATVQTYNHPAAIHERHSRILGTEGKIAQLILNEGLQPQPQSLPGLSVDARKPTARSLFALIALWITRCAAIRAHVHEVDHHRTDVMVVCAQV